jgi:hypothetical protein
VRESQAALLIFVGWMRIQDAWKPDNQEFAAVWNDTRYTLTFEIQY